MTLGKTDAEADTSLSASKKQKEIDRLSNIIAGVRCWQPQICRLTRGRSLSTS